MHANLRSPTHPLPVTEPEVTAVLHVDVGGTTAKPVLIVGRPEQAKLHELERIPTGPGITARGLARLVVDFHALASVLLRAKDSGLNQKRIDRIHVGVPGCVLDGTVVRPPPRTTPNLVGNVAETIRIELAAAGVSTPVAVVNDMRAQVPGVRTTTGEAAVLFLFGTGLSSGGQLPRRTRVVAPGTTWECPAITEWDRHPLECVAGKVRSISELTNHEVYARASANHSLATWRDHVAASILMTVRTFGLQPVYLVGDSLEQMVQLRLAATAANAQLHKDFDAVPIWKDAVRAVAPAEVPLSAPKRATVFHFAARTHITVAMDRFYSTEAAHAPAISTSGTLRTHEEHTGADALHSIQKAYGLPPEHRIKENDGLFDLRIANVRREYSRRLAESIAILAPALGVQHVRVGGGNFHHWGDLASLRLGLRDLTEHFIEVSEADRTQLQAAPLYDERPE